MVILLIMFFLVMKTCVVVNLIIFLRTKGMESHEKADLKWLSYALLGASMLYIGFGIVFNTTPIPLIGLCFAASTTVYETVRQLIRAKWQIPIFPPPTLT